MTLGEIKDAVRKNVLDPDSDLESRFDDLINEAYLEAVDEVEPGVPSLLAVSPLALVTATSSVLLPPGSSGKIVSVYDSNENRLNLLRSLTEIFERYGSLANSGDPCHVAADTVNLHYQPIPSASFNVQVIHYLLPTLLAADGDIPVHIPSHLHRRVLVYGAAAIALREIDQETEEESVMTAVYEAKFQDGKDRYMAWCAARTPSVQNNPTTI